MHSSASRGQAGRPTTEQVTDPQAAKEAQIRAIFTEKKMLLVRLFPKDGETMVARAVSSALAAARKPNEKTGRPALMDISAELIAERCVAAHHMGLDPTSECYLVPYGATLQLIIGPRGLVKLMMNSGFVRKIEARAVREGDTFDYDLGDDGFIRHKKGPNNRDSPVTHAYAFIETTTGGKIREVCTVDDIEFYRSKSKQANGPMWTENYEGACRKTMIHRIAEFVPLAPVMAAALRQNEAGGIEIPEEVMKAVRAKLTAEVLASVGLSAPAGSGAAASGNVEQVPAGGAEPGREPGVEG